jgi:hypothetical protein
MQGLAAFQGTPCHRWREAKHSWLTIKQLTVEAQGE